MPVFRVDKSRDFTVVANCVFKDRSLSAKAKGILVEMLSLPESWDLQIATPPGQQGRNSRSSRDIIPGQQKLVKK